MTTRRSKRQRRAKASATTGGAVALSLSDTVVFLVGLKILLVVIALDPLGADSFGLPKAMVSRALLYVTLPLALAAAIIERARVRPTGMWSLGAAVVIAATAATGLAVDQTTALFGAPRRLLGLTSILDGAATAGLIAMFVDRPRRVAVLAAAATAAVVINVGYAGLQIAGSDPIKWIDPVISGTMGNSSSFAALMAVAFALAWTSLLVGWSRIGWVARSALSALTIVTVALVALSGARAPALALPPAAAAGLVVALRASAVPLPPRRTVPLMLAFGIAALSALLASPAGARLTSLLQGGDTSLMERQLVYGISAEALLRRPLLGVGPDGLISVYQSLRPPESAQLAHVIAAGQTSTHGWLLSHVVGMGIVGGSAILGLFLFALWRAWRAAKEPNGTIRALCLPALIAFGTQGLFTISSIPLELVFWSLVGLAGTDLADVTDPSRTSSRHGTGSWLAVGVAVLLGLAAATMVGGSLAANRALLLSNAAREHGDTSAAARWAGEATRLDPRRADHWNVLGLAYSRRDPPAAIRAFQRAADLAPYDAVYLLNLAADEAVHVERDLSYRGRALRHAGEAVARDPNWPITLRRASEINAVLGQKDEARDLADRAVALRPPSPEHYRWAAEMHATTGDIDGAIRLMETYGAMSWGSGERPREFRVGLAALEMAAGRVERARAIVGAPQFLGATLCGERCVLVRSHSTADLVTSDAAGSVTQVGSYSLDGRPLPAGTRISAQDGGRVVTLMMPTAVTAGESLSVLRVKDAFGSELTVPRVRNVSEADFVPYAAAVLLDEAADLASGADADPARRTKIAEQITSAVALYPDAIPVLKRGAEVSLAAGLTSEATTFAKTVVELVGGSAIHLEWASDVHRRAADPQGALKLLWRSIQISFPAGELPPAVRVRLAEAYRAVGAIDRARELVPPPRLLGAAACNADCFFVYFESVADMVTGDASGSVTRADAYLIDGRPVPTGVSFTVQYGGRVGSVGIPPTADPVLPGQRLRITDVRDTFGNRIDAIEIVFASR